MVTKRVKTTITILIAAAITMTLITGALVGIIIYKLTETENGVVYIDDYDVYMESYTLPEVMFLNEIPDYATVVDFSYYNYWHEDRDRYLELKFDSEKDLNSYLDTLVSWCNSKAFFSGVDLENWFVEMENPYNDSFTDLMYIGLTTTASYKRYTGYETNLINRTVYYKCNFHIISYSVEELTVIQSSTQGSFLKSDDPDLRMPAYFERFGIDAFDSVERRIYLSEEFEIIDYVYHS